MHLPGDSPPDGGDVPDSRPMLDAGPDGPRDDLVDPIGSDRTLDIAAWNLENFPQRYSTPELVADLIASLRLDIVAVEEIADTSAFDRLVARLPSYQAVLSSHTYGNGTYQKVGLVYRSDLFTVKQSSLLFENDSFTFPRPPLAVEMAVNSATGVDLDFVVIVVHLKAGTDTADAQRRALAMEYLDQYVRGLINGSGDDDVIILGDFNETLVAATSPQVWYYVLSAPETYHLTTQVASDGGEYSFLPGDRLLDHIVVTTSLVDELGGRDAHAVRLDREVTEYQAAVSDHLPVAMSMPIFPVPAVR